MNLENNTPRPEQNHFSEKMISSLQDYANEFMALKINFSLGGIDGIRDLLKEFKLKSFDEYIAAKPGYLSDEELKNNNFQNKIKELSTLTRELNESSESLTKEKFDIIIGKVKTIIYEY